MIENLEQGKRFYIPTENEIEQEIRDAHEWYKTAKKDKLFSKGRWKDENQFVAHRIYNLICG